MSAGDVVVLIAAVVGVAAVAGLLVAVGSLRRQVQELVKIADDLRRQTVPLVAEAHRVVDQAATEMERVGAVLESTESVHSTVDSASRLAYRAFANPVVKVLAIRAGAAGGVRRLRARPAAPVRAAAQGRANGKGAR
jgi:predicted PurR-regulated permease PerM